MGSLLMTVQRLTQLVKGALNDYAEDGVWHTVNSTAENQLFLSIDDDNEFVIEITKIEAD